MVKKQVIPSSDRLLLLISVSAGEKDKAAMSHESFLLMANSQSDMDDWVKAIRRVIWAPFGGGKPQNYNTQLVSYTLVITSLHHRMLHVCSHDISSVVSGLRSQKYH